MHHFLEVITIISTLKTGQRSGSRCPRHCSTGPSTDTTLTEYIGFCAHPPFSTRIFIFLRASSIFHAHLHISTHIFNFLRASSIFYAHLRHDQDFPSDTRPRDDPASRLAPGHALVTPPFGLTVATHIAGPLQSCLSSCLPPIGSSTFVWQ